MNIFITGITGFLGRNIASVLAAGHSVMGCGRAGAPLLEDGGSGYVEWDVSRFPWPQEVDGLGIDVIIHAAASLDMDDFSAELVKTNCMGTYNIFRLAVRKKVKQVIYLSSLPVIGKPEGIITEDTPADPLTVYHATKAAGEMIIKQTERYGVPCAVFRIPSPVGPGMPGKTFLSVMVRKALGNEPLEIYGKGTRRQNYVDVRDISSAVKKYIESGADGSGTYNLVSDTALSNAEAAELCRKVTNSRSEIRYSENEDRYDGWEYNASAEKLKSVIGVYAEHSFEESVREIAKDYGGVLWEEN